MEGVPHSVVLQQRSACVLDLKRIPAAHRITHTRNVVNAEKIQKEASSCFFAFTSDGADLRTDVQKFLPGCTGLAPLGGSAASPSRRPEKTAVRW